MRRLLARNILSLGLILFLAPACALAAEPPEEGQFAIAEEQLPSVFEAAGFRLEDSNWHACDDPGTMSYVPGQVANTLDINGDGLSDAVLSEASGYCYGAAGQAYFIVVQQADSSWKVVDTGQGIPVFVETTGTDGWLDFEVGGPGFCFPVMRWNGEAYAKDRNQYDGKPC